MRFFTVPPQPIRLTAYCQLPRKRWSLLVCASTTYKLSPRAGKVAVSGSERSKGVREVKPLGDFLLFPLSQSPYLLGLMWGRMRSS